MDGGLIVPGGYANRGARGLGPANEGVAGVGFDDAQGAAGFKDAMQLGENRVPLLIEMMQHVYARYRIKSIVFEGQRLNRVADRGMQPAAVGQFDAIRRNIEPDDGRSVQSLADDAVSASEFQQATLVGYERVEFVQRFLRVMVQDVGGGEFAEQIALVCVCG